MYSAAQIVGKRRQHNFYIGCTILILENRRLRKLDNLSPQIFFEKPVFLSPILLVCSKNFFKIRAKFLWICVQICPVQCGLVDASLVLLSL
jgi:hypothetical protein